MSLQDTPKFSPTEIWTPHSKHHDLETAIDAAIADMNRQNPGHLIKSLLDEVEQSEQGIVFAILRGEQPAAYSDSDALVIFNPFANAATANMLVRAELVRRAALLADIRDDQGKLKPVIMLASPGLGGSKIRLSQAERQAIKSGELGPAAKELLQAVSHKEFGRVALLGFSQGADMAMAGAREAYSANLDIDGLAVGDPAGVKDRSRLVLARDFTKAGGQELKRAISITNLEAQKKAFGTGVLDFTRFGLSALGRTNLALYKGLGVDSFESRAQKIIEEDLVNKFVVGYGGQSAIAQPDFIEPALQNIYDRNGHDSLISIKVDGAKHTWGDELALLTRLYLCAVV